MKDKYLIISLIGLLLSCIDLDGPFQAPDWQRCSSNSTNIVGYECGNNINADGLKWSVPSNFNDSLRNSIAYQDSICNAQSSGLQFISWLCK